MPDDNNSMRSHAAVAENYGRAILAWMENQPGGCFFDLETARHELGLDPIQFEMGMTWCRLHGYYGPLGFSGSPFASSSAAFERPASLSSFKRHREAMRRALELAHSIDNDDLDDDLEEDDDDVFSERPALPRPRPGDWTDRRFLNATVELELLDRAVRVALVTAVMSGIITWLVVSQFTELKADDRASLAILVYFGFIISLYLAVKFVGSRPEKKPKDTP